MKKSEIIKVFKELSIDVEQLPQYKGADSFADQIKKFSLQKEGQFTYSTGTGCAKEEKNA